MENAYNASIDFICFFFRSHWHFFVILLIPKYRFDMDGHFQSTVQSVSMQFGVCRAEAKMSHVLFCSFSFYMFPAVLCHSFRVVHIGEFETWIWFCFEAGRPPECSLFDL